MVHGDGSCDVVVIHGDGSCDVCSAEWFMVMGHVM